MPINLTEPTPNLALEHWKVTTLPIDFQPIVFFCIAAAMVTVHNFVTRSSYRKQSLAKILPYRSFFFKFIYWLLNRPSLNHFHEPKITFVVVGFCSFTCRIFQFDISIWQQTFLSPCGQCIVQGVMLGQNSDRFDLRVHDVRASVSTHFTASIRKLKMNLMKSNRWILLKHRLSG